MRSLLITGGAGFFGRAFVKYLLSLEGGPSRICIYSRNEWNQAVARREFNDDPRLRWMIGDVRDGSRLREAMADCDAVVHAAALKRVETVNYNVIEAVATNVIGSRNVVQAAIETGCPKAVLISTDKACLPSTTYGLTKAVAERIFLQSDAYVGASPVPLFAVCRYGNVAGSTGSVIPIWREMLASGQVRLPMTNPKCTRFWMTADYAAAFVWSTLNRMQGGELFTPPNLKAFELGDLATALYAATQIIPMAPGEKLHEEMVPGESSEYATRMTVAEIREALEHV